MAGSTVPGLLCVTIVIVPPTWPVVAAVWVPELLQAAARTAALLMIAAARPRFAIGRMASLFDGTRIDLDAARTARRQPATRQEFHLGEYFSLAGNTSPSAGTAATRIITSARAAAALLAHRTA